MRASITEVREFMSAASERTRPKGTREINRMLRTAPREAMPKPGIGVKPCRSISITGTKPTSASPDSTRSAHTLGTAKLSSTRSFCGPWTIP